LVQAIFLFKFDIKSVFQLFFPQVVANIG